MLGAGVEKVSGAQLYSVLVVINFAYGEGLVESAVNWCFDLKKGFFCWRSETIEKQDYSTETRHVRGGLEDDVGREESPEVYIEGQSTPIPYKTYMK